MFSSTPAAQDGLQAMDSLSRSVTEPVTPPVAWDVDAGDVGGFVAGEKRQKLGQFLGATEPFQCGMAQHGAGALLLLQPAHVGVDGPR
jgi:hypothetical protein